MIKFFVKYKIIFYFTNLTLLILYLFPGSLIGGFLYDDFRIQPQITKDFIISSNHFYAFILISIIGFFTYEELKKIRLLHFYLIALSIILEILHIKIPGRNFEWSDLFGNISGVLFVITIYNFIKKYEFFKK
tara:strand:- start:115 stop:510 length:396 start_codon:yes stop_codon:yes gene_type:complete